MGIINRVIVLCTGNICRSPMAAALLRAGLTQTNPRIEVISAGLAAMDGHEADAIAIKLMDERGLDVRGHHAAQFTGQIGLGCDLVLVMDSAQLRFVMQRWPLLHGRVYRLGHWGRFDVNDPYERGEKAFRKALKAIDSGTARWLEIISA